MIDWVFTVCHFTTTKSCSDLWGQQRLTKGQSGSKDTGSGPAKRRPNQLPWMYFLDHAPAPPKSTNVVIDRFLFCRSMWQKQTKKGVLKKNTKQQPRNWQVSEKQRRLDILIMRQYNRVSISKTPTSAMTIVYIDVQLVSTTDPKVGSQSLRYMRLLRFLLPTCELSKRTGVEHIGSSSPIVGCDQYITVGGPDASHSKWLGPIALFDVNWSACSVSVFKLGFERMATWMCEIQFWRWVVFDFYLRPSGKFLATSPGRYLIGQEIMTLMGMPVHLLKTSSCSQRVPCLLLFCGQREPSLGLSCQPPNHQRGSIILAATKTLHSLGGNAMSLRAVLPCISAALAACLPERLSSKWSGWFKLVLWLHHFPMHRIGQSSACFKRMT